MPARDLVITVIYYPEEVIYRKVPQTVIDEYDPPLGIGNLNLNVGECIE